MNIVRSRPLGQFPDYGIVSDLVPPPQDQASPTYATFGPEGTTIPASDITIQPQSPAATVAKPPSSSPTFATFGPYGTLDPTAVSAPVAPGQISPAPKVNIPTSPDQVFGPYGGPLNKTLLGFPVGIWLAIGMGVLVLAAPSGRRRR